MTVGAKVMYDISTEKVPVEIIYTIAGDVLDPRTDFPANKIAFTDSKDTKPSGSKLDAGWHAAAWETNIAVSRFYLTVLVGPQNGGIVLAVAKWATWVYLDGPFEEPVLLAGFTTIK